MTRQSQVEPGLLLNGEESALLSQVEEAIGAVRISRPFGGAYRIVSDRAGVGNCHLVARVFFQAASIKGALEGVLDRVTNLGPHIKIYKESGGQWVATP